MNHAAVVVLIAAPLRGLVLRDGYSGETAEAEATVVVNAAGPWVDQVLAGRRRGAPRTA